MQDQSVFPFCRRRMRQHVRQIYAPRGSEFGLSYWVHVGQTRQLKKMHYQHTNNLLGLQPTQRNSHSWYVSCISTCKGKKKSNRSQQLVHRWRRNGGGRRIYWRYQYLVRSFGGWWRKGLYGSGRASAKSISRFSCNSDGSWSSSSSGRSCSNHSSRSSRSNRGAINT